MCFFAHFTCKICIDKNFLEKMTNKQRDKLIRRGTDFPNANRFGEILQFSSSFSKQCKV